MRDLVSIITPTFNRGYILPLAIKSVLVQTYPHWEMLIVDDGSADDTETVVKNFNDPRLRYFRQENKGQSAARNVGLENAEGKWMTFLDSDNELLPQFLERTTAAFTEHSGILCIIPKGNRTLERYENGVLLETIPIDSFPDDTIKNPAKAVFMRDFIFDPTGFIQSAVIRDEGIRFDENMRYMEDWDYVMTVAEAHPDSFLYIPERLYNYHQRYGVDGLVSNTAYDKHAAVYEYIYLKHKNDKLMEGQTWYPSKMLKWQKMADDFQKGLVPSPDQYPFKKPH
jgi:glycosyltransferase involved in cell wall biosynthesis